MKKLFLLCNAHLDPVWQWEKEEGIGAAISTFSAACDFLDEYDGFVFNHNEAVLYMWIEKYMPVLFERIKKHVKSGKWNIMGGWYLQPDCNMPSGESIVRQILTGRRYFAEKFGVSPSVAINFDSFGHSQGLVQILQDAGYIGYICSRPLKDIPSRDMIWKGFNGSEVLIHRAVDGYNTPMGQAEKYVEKYLDYFKDKDYALLLWGVGNHGGGPSRKDLDDIERLREKHPETQIVHSTPEEYFAMLQERRAKLPVMKEELNYFFQGCYTSQIRVKQAHMKLENELYCVEKMSSYAKIGGGEYPTELLASAQQDLLFSEFHDVLPGTDVPMAEQSALRMLGHGLENCAEAKIKQFLFMAGGEARAAEGEYPVFVYNPHPYAVDCTVECEMMLKDQNFSTQEKYYPRMERDGKEVVCQSEKEESNIPIDWRKKVVFGAHLEPSCMNRFSCYMERGDANRPKKASYGEDENCYTIDFPEKSVILNKKTGLIDSYAAGGKEYVGKDAFCVECIRGSCDPWGFAYDKLSKKAGKFRLMNETQCAQFSAVTGKSLAGVRVIEDGDVRTVFEAAFAYRKSALLVRYIFDRRGSSVGIRMKVYNNEKDMILRMKVPAAFGVGKYYGKTCYGVSELPCNDTEAVAQDWTIMTDGERAVSIVHSGNYGSRCGKGGAGVTLLQSAAYSAHPIADRPILPQDRFSPRIDQGERDFSFEINVSDYASRRRDIEAESLLVHQKPMALNYFPTGEGKKQGSAITVSDPAVMLTAFKPAEDGDGYILRLFNADEVHHRAEICIGGLKIRQTFEIGPSQFLSYRAKHGEIIKTNILEK